MKVNVTIKSFHNQPGVNAYLVIMNEFADFLCITNVVRDFEPFFIVIDNAGHTCREQIDRYREVLLIRTSGSTSTLYRSGSL